jgi:hypothetical protein
MGQARAVPGMVLEQRAEQITGGLFVTFIMAVIASQERKRPLGGQPSGNSST